MNAPASSSSSAPVLKLTRRVSYIAHSVSPDPAQTPAQGQLADEFEALREREENLRAYEARLRAWQEQLDAVSGLPGVGRMVSPVSGSRPPFPTAGDGELQDSWEKFYRARSLLQAEQNQLRDERMTLRDRETALQRREAELAAREALVAAREALVCGAVAAEDEKKAASPVRRLTQAPFLAARSVLGLSR